MSKTTYSTDKDLNAFIAGLVRMGWTFQAQGRLPKIIAPNGRKMPVPRSHADWRMLRNIRKSTERLAALPPDTAERP
ncbi:hypothetical protein [Paraburkholderia tropica]|uniref:hypothetical protein n=1 Tax=Paraburkholderia tropica TaxID=92647 RepID=UPI0031DF6807